MAKTRRAGRKAAPAASGGLVLPAELTIYHAAALRAQFADALAAGQSRFDLAQVTEFDSAGLQLLLAARRSAVQDGRAIEFANAPRVVLEVAATYALDERLEQVA